MGRVSQGKRFGEGREEKRKKMAVCLYFTGIGGDNG